MAELKISESMNKYYVLRDMKNGTYFNGTQWVDGINRAVRHYEKDLEDNFIVNLIKARAE